MTNRNYYHILKQELDCVFKKFHFLANKKATNLVRFVALNLNLDTYLVPNKRSPASPKPGIM